MKILAFAILMIKSWLRRIGLNFTPAFKRFKDCPKFGHPMQLYYCMSSFGVELKRSNWSFSGCFKLNIVRRHLSGIPNSLIQIWWSFCATSKAMSCHFALRTCIGKVRYFVSFKNNPCFRTCLSVGRFSDPNFNSSASILNNFLILGGILWHLKLYMGWKVTITKSCLSN